MLRACRMAIPVAMTVAGLVAVSVQASIINFIEYNWHLPAIPGSFDQALAATDQQEGIPFDLAGMFDFRGSRNQRLFLKPATGEAVSRPGL